MRPAMGCALILAALLGVACPTMVPLTLEQVVALKPDRVWVTGADQSVVLVAGPINVMGDTPVGYVNGKYEELPAGSLNQMTVQSPAKARTVLLAPGLAGGFGGFAYAIAGGGAGKIANATAGDCDKHPEDPGCTPP